MKLFALILGILINVSDLLEASEIENVEVLEREIFALYETLFAAKVIDNLIVNHDIYLQSPNRYWEFLSRTFLDYWDFKATTKALIGHEIYSQLSNSNFEELSRVTELTLIRYAFEILPFYGKQKISIVDVKINEHHTLAWLKIKMISPRIPDIHLDLLLKRTNPNRWKGVDFRFKGITYVNLKKNSYMQDFEDLTFQGLLRKLDNKNKVFFSDLCEHNFHYIDPKKPPCLQNYDKK